MNVFRVQRVWWWKKRRQNITYHSLATLVVTKDYHHACWVSLDDRHPRRAALSPREHVATASLLPPTCTAHDMHCSLQYDSMNHEPSNIHNPSNKPTLPTSSRETPCRILIPLHLECVESYTSTFKRCRIIIPLYLKVNNAYSSPFKWNTLFTDTLVH